MKPVTMWPLTVRLAILGVAFVLLAALVFLWSYGGCSASALLGSCPATAEVYFLRDALLATGLVAISVGLGFLVTRFARTPIIEKRRGLAGAVIAIAACAAIGVAILVPIPQSFSMHEAAIYDLEMGCPGIYTTQGTTVTFHWSAASSTGFAVVSCSANQVVYEGNGTVGSGSFVSVGGVYEFGSTCPGPEPCYPADVTGSFTSPLLPL